VQGLKKLPDFIQMHEDRSFLPNHNAGEFVTAIPVSRRRKTCLSTECEFLMKEEFYET